MTSSAEAKRLSEPSKTPAPAAVLSGSGAAAATAPVAAKPKRKPFLILAVLVGAGLLAMGGYAYTTAGQESTDDAQVEANAVPVAARASGSVRKLYVTDNQQVKSGELLLELDDSDLQAHLLQANAELAVAEAQAQAAGAQEQVVSASAQGGLHSAKAQVSSSRVGVQSAELQIEVSRFALSRAQTNAKRAQLDLARANELHDKSAIAQDRLDSAQLANDSAQAALAEARAELGAAQEARAGAVSRVADAQGKLAASTPTEALIAAAHAQHELALAHVKAAQAAVQLAQIELTHAKIVAPADGVISRISALQGQLLSENQVIGVLVPSTTYVVANFKETQIGKMRRGDAASIELDAYPGLHFEAQVESLSGGTGARFSLLPPDNASGNFVKVVQRVPVRLAWRSDPNVALQAGLSANVTVHVHGG